MLLQSSLLTNCKISGDVASRLRSIVGDVPKNPASVNNIRKSLVDELDICLRLSQLFAPRVASTTAWAMRKLEIDDRRLWNVVMESSLLIESTHAGDLSTILFSLAEVDHKKVTRLSPEGIALVHRHLVQLSRRPEWVGNLRFADIAQILYSTCVLFPVARDISLIYLNRVKTCLNDLPKCLVANEIVPKLDSCSEVVLLWSTLRMWPKGNTDWILILEPLLEASRSLRFCEDFNQHKAGQLAESVAAMGITDARVVYQLIHYVDRNWKVLNRKNILRFVNCFRKLHVSNPVAWKRLSSKLEDSVGLSFTVDELEHIRNVMQKLGVGSRRTFGIIQLYIRTKQEQLAYGPS